MRLITPPHTLTTTCTPNKQGAFHKSNANNNNNTNTGNNNNNSNKCRMQCYRGERREEKPLPNSRNIR